MKSTTTYFFDDKPLFGLDIGHDTLRVMQFDPKQRKTLQLKGYGSAVFDPAAITDGVITKPELVAKAALNMFHKDLIGDISTDRVAVSLPARRALTRAVRLPQMGAKDIDSAVQTEIEQYIPGHADEFYLDYTTLREDKDGMELFVVAMPKKIVDSYLLLMRMLGLEAVLLDTTIGASSQMFVYDKQSAVPSVLVDFGTENTDITVYSSGIVVTGTAAFGGDDVTTTIAKVLQITPREAIMLKSKYGLARSVVRDQIIAAINPSLEVLIKEIRRTIRYYEQRYAKEQPIGQIVVMGGGASMPGMVDFLTDRLRLPARSFDPSNYLKFGHLHPFHTADSMAYVTVAGLAAANPAEIFT